MKLASMLALSSRRSTGSMTKPWAETRVRWLTLREKGKRTGGLVITHVTVLVHVDVGVYKELYQWVYSDGDCGHHSPRAA